jgi:mannose-6-phosphate isomerase-like protein (cupin superfamily)
MGDLTLVNLKEVEDQAPGFGFSPDLEARFAREDLGLERSGISYQRLAANYRTPFAHRHEKQEEIYVVMGGGGRMKLDDEVVELGAMDAVRVPPGVVRCLEGGPEGIEFLVFGTPRGKEEGPDIEMLPGWWRD